MLEFRTYAALTETRRFEIKVVRLADACCALWNCADGGAAGITKGQPLAADHSDEDLAAAVVGQLSEALAFIEAHYGRAVSVMPVDSPQYTFPAAGAAI